MLNKVRRWIYRKNKRKNILEIALVFDGGIGDALIYLNYSKYLYRYTNNNAVVDVYSKQRQLQKIISSEDSFIRRFFGKKEIKGKEYQYDVVIQMKERYPLIVYYDPTRIERICPDLINLISAYNRHFLKHKFYYTQSPKTDGLSALFSLIIGANRLTQPDIDSLLGVKDVILSIPSFNNEKVLKKFSLKSGEYITINRSVDASSSNYESTKLWGIENYSNLIRMIVASRPNIKIVYLSPRVEILPNERSLQLINLSGKTNFEEFMVLLKCAKLHIGPEGGMIHLRHYLSRKPSCVLFGPTSRAFYSYCENINLEINNICLMQCEWVTEDWQDKCLKNGTSTCEKLSAIKPEYVYNSIKDLL